MMFIPVLARVPLRSRRGRMGMHQQVIHWMGSHKQFRESNNGCLHTEGAEHR